MSIKRPGGRTGESWHVSPSPSKIPYGGFSPVRLQTGYQPWRPSPVSRSAVSVRHASAPSPHRLIRHHPPSAGAPVVLADKISGPLPGRSSPAALGSPAGYVVPPGHRLLWPHPSLSVLPPTYLSSYSGSFPVSLFQGCPERFPNLLCMSFSPCRLPYPVGPGRCF